MDDYPIYKALAGFAAADDLKVDKDGVNPHFNYNYMTEPALFNAARAALAAQGLSATISFEQGSHETVMTHNRQNEEVPQILATIQARLSIRDQSGHSVECFAYGQGMDPADKAYAKAMTMASKYVVQKALMIAVEADDSDSQVATGTIRRTVSSGGGGGLASEKQLNFLAVLIKQKLGYEGAAEPLGMRLAALEGQKVDMYEAIGRDTASSLIEKLQVMTPAKAPALYAKLAQFEGAAPAPDTPAAPSNGEPIRGEVMTHETALEAMHRMVEEEAAGWNPETEPAPQVVSPPPVSVALEENVRTLTPPQIRLIHALCGQAALTDDRRREIVMEETGTPHVDRVPMELMDKLKTRLMVEVELANEEGPGG